MTTASVRSRVITSYFTGFIGLTNESDCQAANNQSSFKRLMWGTHHVGVEVSPGNGNPNGSLWASKLRYDNCANQYPSG
jgi:hypothetical protein